MLLEPAHSGGVAGGSLGRDAFLNQLLAPRQLLLGLFLGWLQTVLYLFGVVVGVGQHDILVCFALVPGGGHLGTLSHPLFQFLHLDQVVVPDLKALLLGVDQFEALVERPTILAHEVGTEDCGGSGLAVEGVD